MKIRTNAKAGQDTPENERAGHLRHMPGKDQWGGQAPSVYWRQVAGPLRDI